jgi:AraC-like DNA-binding protein
LLLTRLKKAAVLLAETELPVTRVAMDTGFSTTSYFIQRFKDYQGTTPSGSAAGSASRSRMGMG